MLKVEQRQKNQMTFCTLRYPWHKCLIPWYKCHIPWCSWMAFSLAVKNKTKNNHTEKETGNSAEGAMPPGYCCFTSIPSWSQYWVCARAYTQNGPVELRTRYQTGRISSGSTDHNNLFSEKISTRIALSVTWSLKGLFTWRWSTPDRWGDLIRWGNPPVHIISHFNVITFTW